MSRLIVLFTVLFTACSSEDAQAPDLFIGPTAIVFKYLAEPEPELTRTLWNSHACLLQFDRFGTFRYFPWDVDEMLTVRLELHGRGSKVDIEGDVEGYGRLFGKYVHGLYSPRARSATGEPTIQVLQSDEDGWGFVEVFLHEFFNHRTRDVIFRNGGQGGHDELWESNVAEHKKCVREGGIR